MECHDQGGQDQLHTKGQAMNAKNWFVFQGLFLSEHSDWEFCVWVHPDRCPTDEEQCCRKMDAILREVAKNLIPSWFDIDLQLTVERVGISPEQSRSLTEMIDCIGKGAIAWVCVHPHVLRPVENHYHAEK
jgi:hypothetical protein